MRAPAAGNLCVRRPQVIYACVPTMVIHNRPANRRFTFFFRFFFIVISLPSLSNEVQTSAGRLSGAALPRVNVREALRTKCELLMSRPSNPSRAARFPWPTVFPPALQTIDYIPLYNQTKANLKKFKSIFKPCFFWYN